MEQRETKTFTATVKAADPATMTAGKGEFVAVVSVFGNIDLGGDRVMRGAFTNALEKMKANREVLPIIWSHDWENPQAHIGYADPADIVETEEGLQLKGVLDTDRPFAEQVHHLMVNRRVKEFSFGYFVNASQDVTDADGTAVRELTDIDIFEAGPTLKGMNPETRLLQAASALKDQAGKSMENSAYPLTPLQRLQYEATEHNVEIAGMYDQTTGGQGAHYAPAEANPFKGEGLVCSNCVFYAGPRACEVVAGDIDPEAVCKLWIIPEALLQITEAPTEDTTPKTLTAEETQTEAVEQTEETQEPPAAHVAGDTIGTIDAERLLNLLVKPKH